SLLPVERSAKSVVAAPQAACVHNRLKYLRIYADYTARPAQPVCVIAATTRLILPEKAPARCI
ncbi:MAG TPA: hypothetical protein VG475_08975, partial [Pseudolabrys sp.]|nr:hypothetical protein [Pseudolabrys sp.]